MLVGFISSGSGQIDRILFFELADELDFGFASFG